MKAVLLNTVWAIVLSGGHPSGPVTTYSSPVVNVSDVVACIVQNLADESVVVEATLHHPGGGVLDSGQGEILPGRTVELASSDDDLIGPYCSFVVDGDSATVRGYVHLRPAVGGDTQALFGSLPARDGGAISMQRFSPPLRSINNDFLACLVQNLADHSVEVETILFDGNGIAVDSSVDEVAAGRAMVTVSSNDDLLNGYCRFAFEAGPEEVRGYSLFTDGNPSLVLPAASASAPFDLVTHTPILSSVAGDATGCVVQNLDDMPRQISAELMDSSGVLSSNSVVVQPGAVAQITGQTEAADNAYCKFTYDNDDDILRAFLTRFPSGLFANTDFLAAASTGVAVAVSDLTTYSPPVQVADGQLHCLIENLTGGGVPVHVEINDGNGGIVAMADVVAPQERGTTALTTTENLSGAFCTFTYDGNVGEMRTFAALTNAAGTRTRLLSQAQPRGLATFSTPTPTETSTPRPTFTRTPTATEVPTATSTRQPTATATKEPTETPTAEPSPTSTDTPVPTQTPTATAEDTPTLTPTSMLEPTTTPSLPCVGDCDGDGMVTVDEILKMVNIALGAPIEECPAGDRDGDGDVTVDEILAAVANALDGCPVG